MVLGAAKYLNNLEEYGRIHLGESLQKDADDLLYKSDSVHNFVADCIRPDEGNAIISLDAYMPYVNLTISLVFSDLPVTLRTSIAAFINVSFLGAAAGGLPITAKVLLYANIPADWEEQKKVVGMG